MIVARDRALRIKEMAIESLIRLCGVSAVAFVFGIFYFVFREGAPLLFGGLDLGQFFTSQAWYPDSPSHKRYGALALIEAHPRVAASFQLGPQSPALPRSQRQFDHGRLHST